MLSLLALMMVFSLTACGGNGGNGGNTPTVYEGDKEYVFLDTFEDYNMDYLTTALASDHDLNANFVDGLLENDSFGNYIPALAESYDVNEDATVFTFKLRQGVYWVNANGEQYAEVTANDFVAGLRHAAEFNSGTASVVFCIAGFEDYFNKGDWSDEAWANVGVKAVDDYTLEYTLKESTPYFYTMTTYTCLFPVNQEFLESKGAGCKLGAPDKTTCEFGTGSTPEAILYNGGYVLTSYDVKSAYTMKKNEAYWDKDNVFVESVKCIYTDGSDPYLGINQFEQGSVAAAALNPAWSDLDTYLEKYKDYATVSLPNEYAFGVVFNFNRQVWNLTNYATTDEARENTHNAICNANFRRALRAAFDVNSYLATRSVPEVAKGTVRNMNSIPTLVSTSDGTSYGNLVEAAYTEMTGETVDLDDGQYPWLNKETALDYIEKAKAEGVVFPVHLDMLCIETSDGLMRQAQSMKNSIEENTDGQIIIEIVARDTNTVYNIAYYNEDYKEADYDISTFTGWGPDYVDPKTFVEIYSPVDGYYMTTCGMTDATNPDFGKDDELKTALGFYEYERLFREADAIKSDTDARYAAFAKADAYLIEEALYIPTSQQTRSLRVSRVVPFTAPFANSGVAKLKYKYMQLTKDGAIVTVEEYNAAQEKWSKGEK